MTRTSGGVTPPRRGRPRASGPGPVSWVGARLRAHAASQSLIEVLIGRRRSYRPALSTVRFLGPPKTGRDAKA